MDLYRKVRLACAEGMSAREAARHFGISRDSVRKMLSFSVPRGYRRTAPVRRPKLDGFTPIIDAWLEADRGVHRKQRHTAKRVIERLRDERGYAPLLPDLLDQIPARQSIDMVTADGAYDTRACHAAIAERAAAAVIPPRKNGKPWSGQTAGASVRNDALRSCRRLGRAIWKRWSGYHR